jgi:tetratricopeptide (TPR) repeat protein/predicted Ser/Thr protein kinase
MADAHRCPNCGFERPANATGDLCPQCLIRQATAGEASVPPEVDATNEPGAKGSGQSPRPTEADPQATGTYSPGPVAYTMQNPETATGDWSDRPTDPNATTGDPSAPRDLPRGATVRYFGDYEIQKELGRGGMGVVYKARQVSLNRPVALKMIKAGVLADDDELRRFQNEAEAVALLDHAGIVPVYEVGDREGQRYFSMKLVEGGNLGERLASFKANPRAAATLLAETAEAVHHAHMRGILHRDLKPANILVDAEGHPHVTDFGLAKRVEADVEMTASGAILGTPAYMSPEQANGRRGSITTATDVYGLGAILYAMLTGKSPFGGASVMETLDAVRTRPPEPPTKLNGSTPRDLDTICLKCLEKDPRRRYASAHELASDLNNWLDSRPITARRVGSAERAWLWCKRKPAVAALTAAVVLAAVCGTGAVIVVQARANRDLLASNTKLDEQRVRAEDNETQAIDAVKKFGDAVTDEAELKSSPALDGLRKRLLKEPLAFFSSLRGRLQADRDTRPESLARLARASYDLGRLTNEIGNKEDALVAVREASAIQWRLADANPTVTRWQSDLAESHNSIGVLLNATGQSTEALKAYESALAIFQKLADANPTVTDLLRNLAVSHNNIANLLSATGQSTEALKAFQSALAIERKLADANPTVTMFQSDLAFSHNNIGILLCNTGQPAEALKAFQSALLIQQRLADANPTINECQRDLAVSHNNIANLLSNAGQPAEALKAFRSALEINQKLTDANPTVTGFLRNLAASHCNIGILLNATGQSAEALNAFQSALEIQRKLADANPTVTPFQSDLAVTHNSIGNLLSATGQSAEALKAYEAALAIRRRLADANPHLTPFQIDLAASHNNIGLLLSATGQPAEALKAHQSALAIQQKLADANPTITQFQRDLAVSYDNVGLLLSATGRPAGALKAHQSALAIFQKLADVNPTITDFLRSLAATHNSIGNLMSTTGQPAEALKSYQSALAIRRKLADANPTVTRFQSDLASTHFSIGNLLSATGQPTEALKAHEAALAIQQVLADANPTATSFQHDLADSHDNIGLLLSVTGRPVETLKAHEAALAIRQKLAREHPESPDFASRLGGSLNNLALLDLNAKRFEEARVRLQEAVEWQRKALAANPANPVYRQFLTNHWSNLILAARGLGDSEGVAEAEREQAKLRDSDPALLALDARLSAIVRGDQQPSDNRERLQLSQRAYDKALHSAAAKLWADALDADPKLAQDRRAQHRYNAACAAALAGSGQAKDNPAPDDKAKAKLREQSREWLQAELALWSKYVEAGPPQARPVIVQTLQHWQKDTDLAGIREPKALDALPEAEREGFRALWASVEALRNKAEGP